MRGRRPKPLAMKIAEGNAGKRKLPREANYADGVGEPPEHLTTEGKSEWERIVSVVVSERILKQTDRAALAAYCGAYGRWVEAERILKRDGILSAGATGNTVAHPAVSISSDSLRLMHRYLIEFGFTPAARAKVIGQDLAAKPGDELTDFMRIAL